MKKAVKTVTIQDLATAFCSAVGDYLDDKKPASIIQAADVVTGYIDGMLIRFAKMNGSYQPVIKPAHLKNPTIDDIDPKTRSERFELQYVVESVVEGMPETYKDLFAAKDAGAPITAKIMETNDFKKLSERFGEKKLKPQVTFFVPMQTDSGMAGFIGLKCEIAQP